MICGFVAAAVRRYARMFRGKSMDGIKMYQGSPGIVALYALCFKHTMPNAQRLLLLPATLVRDNRNDISGCRRTFVDCWQIGMKWYDTVVRHARCWHDILATSCNTLVGHSCKTPSDDTLRRHTWGDTLVKLCSYDTWSDTLARHSWYATLGMRFFTWKS